MINYSKSISILKNSKIKIKNEILDSSKSLNRVSAENIFSKVNYPAENNAAFDGYAINSSDTKNINKKKSKIFKIVGSVAAGMKPLAKKIKKFDTIEIMTGSIISKPFNTIIPIEQIKFFPNKKSKKNIIISKKIDKNDHVRFKGSDYKKGELIIKSGTIIQPNHILALKSLGIKKIKVKKK